MRTSHSHRFDVQSLFSRILCIGMLLCQFPFVAPVSAQQPASTPPVQQDIRFSMVAVGDHPTGFFRDLNISPGETMDLEVEISNQGNTPVDLRLYNTNARSGINGGFLADEHGSELESPATWVSLEEQTFLLQPDEHRIVPLSVTVPPDTDPGQYISALVVETVNAMPVDGTDMFDQIMRYSLSLGVLVPGDITHEFYLGEPVVDDRSLTIPIANTGNYLVRPSGEFQLKDMSGNEVVSQTMELGSVYGGAETSVFIYLPEHIPAGDYLVSLSLADEGSSASDSVESAPVTIQDIDDAVGLSLSDYSITPNADEIAFANVSLTIENSGQSLPATTIILGVSRDGEMVEEFPMATNQLISNGSNVVEARYIPTDLWEQGTYTFAVKILAVDPDSDLEIELLSQNLDAEIVVP